MPLERVPFLTLHSSAFEFVLMPTSPRLSILNAELPPNDGESGAGDIADGQDDGRKRSHTNGLGAGNQKAKGNGGFL